MVATNMSIFGNPQPVNATLFGENGRSLEIRVSLIIQVGPKSSNYPSKGRTEEGHREGDGHAKMEAEI